VAAVNHPLNPYDVVLGVIAEQHQIVAVHRHTQAWSKALASGIKQWRARHRDALRFKLVDE
jgi:hypothetical protein